MSENREIKDMHPLEGRFDTVPHRERWDIPGLYELPEVRVVLNGGELPLQSRLGESYTYEAPDARAYSFRFLAPADAAVTIDNTEISGNMATVTVSVRTSPDSEPETSTKTLVLKDSRWIITGI